VRQYNGALVSGIVWIKSVALARIPPSRRPAVGGNSCAGDGILPIIAEHP
jgi:hypothetical protein